MIHDWSHPKGRLYETSFHLIDPWTSVDRSSPLFTHEWNILPPFSDPQHVPTITRWYSHWELKVGGGGEGFNGMTNHCFHACAFMSWWFKSIFVEIWKISNSWIKQLHITNPIPTKASYLNRVLIHRSHYASLVPYWQELMWTLKYFKGIAFQNDKILTWFFFPVD